MSHPITTRDKFIVLCQQGDLHLLRQAVENLGMKASRWSAFTQMTKLVYHSCTQRFLPQSLLNKALRLACMNGHLEVAQYLLGSPDLLLHADIHACDDQAFKVACREGHLDIAEYLLTSPELKQHANVHADNDYPLRGACQQGRLEVVKYLLSSPQLSEHADIHALNDEPLYHAVRHNHLDIVRYLLASPELTEHSNPCARGDEVKVFALEFNDLEMVRFFLYDLGMDIQESLYAKLSESKQKAITQMVARRDMFFVLHDTLEDKHVELAPKPKL